jgi:AraC family transcriptional regulator
MTREGYYRDLVNYIGQYVHDHVGEPLTIDLIAAKVGVSRYHVNRIFHAATGFLLGEFIQRRRLEQAYTLLSDTRAEIIEVALRVGYESHSAFSRAFLKAFGRNPNEVRRGEAPRFALPQLIKQASRPDVRPEIVTLERQDLVGLYGQGFQDQSFVALAARLYEQLANELGLTRGFDPAVHRLVGVSLDSPWVGEQEQSRFFAGMLLASNASGSRRLKRYHWPGGQWARFTHTGPYQTMWQTISRIYAGWIVNENIVLRNEAIVQRYLTLPADVPQEQLETHLYFPLETGELP